MTEAQRWAGGWAAVVAGGAGCWAVMRTRDPCRSQTSRDDNGPAAPSSRSRARPSPRRRWSERDRDDDVRPDRRTAAHGPSPGGSEPRARALERGNSWEFLRSEDQVAPAGARDPEASAAVRARTPGRPKAFFGGHWGPDVRDVRRPSASGLASDDVNATGARARRPSTCGAGEVLPAEDFVHVVGDHGCVPRFRRRSSGVA
jgi:hypothetical protein